MADNHVVEKFSSKFRDLHYISIFYKLLLFIIVFYFFKINHAATLFTAISACVSYLLYDILTPEVVDKEPELLATENEKCERLMSDLSNHLKNVEEEKKLVSHLEEKCANLTKDIELERTVYKTWKVNEQIHRKKLEDEKENLARDVKEEKKKNERLELLVDGLRKTIDSLVLDKDRNLNYLKNSTDDTLKLIKSEIANGFDEFIEVIEKAADDEAEQESEDEGKEFLEKLAGIEKQMDNLVKENKDLNICVTQDMSKLIKSEIAKGFDKVKEMAEKAEMDKAEEELESIKEFREEWEEFPEKLTALEKQVDNLVKENKDLNMYVKQDMSKLIKSEIANGFDRAKEMVEKATNDEAKQESKITPEFREHWKEYLETWNKSRSLVDNDTSSSSNSDDDDDDDDGYEVVEEI